MLATTVIVLLAQVAASAGSLDSSAWQMRAERPADAELECTYYSSMFWSVSVESGALRTAVLKVREHIDPIPFRYTPDRDRAGDRHVARVRDGWVVGFDDGEFGGGLWWFSRDGRKSRRIRPDPSSPVNPGDIFHAENVLGLPEVAGERLVLMGLDHLIGRSGRIFRLVSRAGQWALSPVAVLDAEPDPWLVDGRRLLVVTDSGLWSTEATGGAKRIYEANLGRFAPTSLVRGPDDALYLGLRHYVLRLEEQDGKWKESWYIPSDCVNVQMRDSTCECVR